MRNFVFRCVSLIAVLCVLLTGVPARAQGRPAASVCYVDAGAGAANSGLSWANAYTDLQSALGNVACTEIWVKAGWYTPGTSQSDTFNIPPGMAVYGGFAGTERLRTERNPAVNVTILSGDIDNNDINTDGNHIDETTLNVQGGNSYTLVTMEGTSTPVTGSTVLDGFTITGGSQKWGDPGVGGAGLYCNGSTVSGVCSPTLANLVFLGNYSIGACGAMENDDFPGGDSSPSLTNVVFSGNFAGSGGAMCSGSVSSPSLRNVTFTGNSAFYDGGAMVTGGNISLTNVTFSGNSSDEFGGAIENFSSGLTLTNVTFYNNSAGEGGAIYDNGNFDNFGTGASSPTLTNVTFSGNSASLDGGAMYNNGSSSSGASSPTLTNITFSGNSASNNGGAMYNNGSSSGASSPALTNITFNGNHANKYGGAIYNDGSSGSSSPTLTNVTFNANTAVRGGAVFSDGSAAGSSTATFTNVTLNGNSATDYGGALYNTAVFGASHLSLTNVILWGDSAPTGPEIYNATATTSISYSVVQHAYGKTGLWDTNLGYDGGGNLGTDPMLGALADNGGHIQTMGLSLGSSAIDTGDDGPCPSSDQRGVSSPQGPRCDIGAYEFMVPTIARLYPAEGSSACLIPGIGVDLLLTDQVRTGGSFDPATITLQLDGSNVTSSARITQDMSYPASRARVLYAPVSSLSAGSHAVDFTYPTGTTPQTRHWTFTAASSTCPLMAEASAEPSLLSAPEPTELASPGADNSEPPAPTLEPSLPSVPEPTELASPSADNSEPPAPTAEPSLSPVPEPSQAAVPAPNNSPPEDPYPLLIGRPR